MGGSSKSASNTNTTTTTTSKSNSTAFNDAVNGNVISGVENSTITMTDGGAVDAAMNAIVNVSQDAFDFGRDSLSFSDSAMSKALQFGSNALEVSQNATAAALDVASNITRDNDSATAQESVKYMSLSMVAAAVAFAVMSKGK